MAMKSWGWCWAIYSQKIFFIGQWLHLNTDISIIGLQTPVCHLTNILTTQSLVKTIIHQGCNWEAEPQIKKKDFYSTYFLIQMDDGFFPFLDLRGLNCFLKSLPLHKVVWCNWFPDATGFCSHWRVCATLISIFSSPPNRDAFLFYLIKKKSFSKDRHSNLKFLIVTTDTSFTGWGQCGATGK